MAITDTHTRVTIQIPGHTIDVPLSADQPLAALIGEIVAYVRDVFSDDEDVQEWIGNRTSIWRLASPLGKLYPDDYSLNNLDICDGEVLVLVDSDQRETYALLVDDVAEAIARHQRGNFSEWSPDNARSLSSLALAMVVAVASTVGVFCAFSPSVPAVGRLAIAVVLAIAAVSAVAALAIIVRSGSGDDDHAVTAVAASGYITAGAAAVTAVPGDIGVWSAVAGGLVVGAMAIMIAVGIGAAERITYAAGAAGTVSLVAAGLTVLSQVEPLVFGVLLSVVAVGFLLVASRLSLIIARIPMPFVPAAGDTFVRDDADDVSTVEVGSGHAAITAIINQEKKNITANHCIVGLTWGGIAAIVTGAAIAGASLNHHTAAVVALFAFVTLAMLFRGKSFSDAVIQRSWLSGAAIAGAAFTVAAAGTGAMYPALAGTGFIAAGAVAAFYVTVRGVKVNSPVILKLGELFEGLCFAAPVVLIVLILDPYGTARGL